jgi:hypothetical protein
MFRISVCSVEREREKMSQRYTVNAEINRQYSRLNAIGTQLSVRLLPSPPDSYPVTHFLDIISDLFEYALRNLTSPIWSVSRLVTKIMCRINR